MRKSLMRHRFPWLMQGFIGILDILEGLECHFTGYWWWGIPPWCWITFGAIMLLGAIPYIISPSLWE